MATDVNLLKTAITPTVLATPLGSESPVETLPQGASTPSAKRKTANPDPDRKYMQQMLCALW